MTDKKAATIVVLIGILGVVFIAAGIYTIRRQALHNQAIGSCVANCTPTPISATPAPSPKATNEPKQAKLDDFIKTIPGQVSAGPGIKIIVENPASKPTSEPFCNDAKPPSNLPCRIDISAIATDNQGVTSKPYTIRFHLSKCPGHSCG